MRNGLKKVAAVRTGYPCIFCMSSDCRRRLRPSIRDARPARRPITTNRRLFAVTCRVPSRDLVVRPIQRSPPTTLKAPGLEAISTSRRRRSSRPRIGRTVASRSENSGNVRRTSQCELLRHDRNRMLSETRGQKPSILPSLFRPLHPETNAREWAEGGGMWHFCIARPGNRQPPRHRR